MGQETAGSGHKEPPKVTDLEERVGCKEAILLLSGGQAGGERW